MTTQSEMTNENTIAFHQKRSDWRTDMLCSLLIAALVSSTALWPGVEETRSATWPSVFPTEAMLTMLELESFEAEMSQGGIPLVLPCQGEDAMHNMEGSALYIAMNVVVSSIDAEVGAMSYAGLARDDGGPRLGRSQEGASLRRLAGKHAVE
jgi:hypothetical protein